jgi:crotonobetainyl-CoA:carnitine CoA-transferase CaiB-like acyl-CoA transferase
VEKHSRYAAAAMEEAADTIDSLTARLAAAEARSMAKEYEELRSIIDGGSVTMTHEDAVEELRDRDARLAEVEEAARILLDDLSQFTRTEWLIERWPWLAEEKKGSGREV